MEKVLIITYYWPPSGGAGVQRILKFVKYLPQFGIIPYVVTVDEKKASYPVIDKTLNDDVSPDAIVMRTDTFEPFDIYSKLLGKKNIPTGFSGESNPGAFQKFSRFVRGNFFIPDARRGWVKFAFKEASKIIEEENIKTVLTTSPPHSAQLIGLMLKKKYNINWIADLRDPWTDIYYYNEFNHLEHAKKLDLKYEREVLENADRVITVSSDLKNLFIKKSVSIQASKFSVIPNGYDEDDFMESVSLKSSKKDFTISYTGTLADSYKPEIFFHALKNITDKFSDVNFKIKFIGNPAPNVIEQAKNISLSKNLELISTVSHTDSIKYLFRSNVLLLVIPDVKNDKGILTGKLFEYLAAEKQIICIGPADGDAAKIINECEAGRTFNRNMENELAQYFEQLVNKWLSGESLDVKNGIYNKYSRRRQTEELSEIIKCN